MTEELENQLEQNEQNEQQLTNRELYQLKKQSKQKEREQQERKRTIKKIINIVGIVVIAGGGILALVWFLNDKLSIPESEIISKQGIHWHAELSIKILGQYQGLSTDIGIGAVHNPIHTHESDGVVHMEFSGLVEKDNIRLERFFEIWKETFNKDCILDKCNGSEGQVKMFVNGEENYEFENYIMKDGNKIEIIFE